MAILQISRIQVRRGLYENIPPALASGELGWAVDERRLFIGNGTYDEGAPELGNTEILTSHWMANGGVLSLSGLYTYSGANANHTVSTGQTYTSQVSRSMQDKFDDIANFRDFGGIGDGITDEAPALNWAISQLYKDSFPASGSPSDRRERRTLYLPAGIFVLTSAAISILPYVRLVGAGKNATFIVQTNELYPVLQSAQFMSGTVPVIEAGRFEIEGMTLVNATNNDIVSFDSITDVLMNRVRMTNSNDLAAETAPTATNQFSCVRIAGSTGNPGSTLLSSNILFNECEFGGKYYAFYCDNNVSNVNFVGCRFTHLYHGLYLGQAFTGNSTIDSIRVTHSYFDAVAREAIYASTSANIQGVVSAFNTFKAVGDPATTNVLLFGGDNCYSIGDSFDRAADSTFPSVALNGKASFATLKDGRIQLGRELQVGGRVATLANNTVSATSTNLVVGVGIGSTSMSYRITRATNERVGALTIASTGTDLTYDDSYVESDDIGIDLIPVINGGVIELQFTSTDDITDATLLTSSKSLV